MKTWIDFAKHFPHEFTIQYPPRREYFQEFFKSELPEKPFENHDDLALYLHVPFCEAKCFYCNFAVDVRSSRKLYDDYVHKLLEEIDTNFALLERKNIRGIDIGGGTPTRLPMDLLEKLLSSLHPIWKKSKGELISIETTPGIASAEPEKLLMLANNGVGRISIGIQSFNSEHLENVNRIREVEKADQAIINVWKAGFTNLNIDLIFGLPNQTLESWNEDLLRVIAYAPASITIYDCLYRGKGRALTKRTANLPSLETYGILYDHAFELLKNCGYHGEYGSVNFSKTGGFGVSEYFQSRLLEGLPYLGLGNYASSQVDDYWFFKPYQVGKYLSMEDTSEMDVYKLPSDEIQAKYILYSLNFGFVDSVRFVNRFGRTFEQCYSKELQFAVEQGWIERDQTKWKLKRNNFVNMNMLRSLFYSKKAKDWLRNLRDRD